MTLFRIVIMLLDSQFTVDQPNCTEGLNLTMKRFCSVTKQDEVSEEQMSLHIENVCKDERT